MARRIEEHDPVLWTGLIGGPSSAECLNAGERLVIVLRRNVEMGLDLLIPVWPVGRTEVLVALETEVYPSAGVELYPSVVGGRTVVNLAA
jgi:predicted metal-dependent RNase